jgi:hypothetical protein
MRVFFNKIKGLILLNVDNFVTRLISRHNNLNLTTTLNWLIVSHEGLTVLC